MTKPGGLATNCSRQNGRRRGPGWWKKGEKNGWKDENCGLAHMLNMQSGLISPNNLIQFAVFFVGASFKRSYKRLLGTEPSRVI